MPKLVKIMACEVIFSVYDYFFLVQYINHLVQKSRKDCVRPNVFPSKLGKYTKNHNISTVLTSHFTQNKINLKLIWHRLSLFRSL